MPKTKLSAFLSVLLLLASGAAMSRGYRLRRENGHQPRQTHTQESPEGSRKVVVSRLKEAVHLDDQQLSRVQKIYDERAPGSRKLTRTSTPKFSRSIVNSPMSAIFDMKRR